MSEVIPFPKVDKPENVAALEAMTDAVRTAMAIGFDREKFITCAALVWDGVVLTDGVDEK